MLNNKKVRIKKLIELDSQIRGLDDDYENTERVSRLIYEDDRRKLLGERNRIEKSRNRASLIFVTAIVLIFGLVFLFGHKSARAECAYIEEHIPGLNRG